MRRLSVSQQHCSRQPVSFSRSPTSRFPSRGPLDLDSVAEFKIRIKHLGLSECMDIFDAVGATNFETFVIAATYSPNSADESAFIKEIMVPIGRAETHPEKLALRRLLVEPFPMLRRRWKERPIHVRRKCRANFRLQNGSCAVLADLGNCVLNQTRRIQKPRELDMQR